MPAPFRVERRLAFGEADPAGTIYTPRAIDFALQAVELAWHESVGTPFRELAQRRRLGAPWVKASVEFRRPLLAGDAYTLEMRLVRIGGSSMQWLGEARRADGEVAFVVDMVEVMTDLDTGRATRVPDDIRAALARYLVP